MKDLTRFVQLVLLAVILFVALLAAWGVAVYGSPLAWFGAVVLGLLFLWLAAVVAVDVVQDAQIKDAQHKREMQAAGYVFIEGRWWAWEDGDGDGEIDAGELAEYPRIVTIRGGAKEQVTAGDLGYLACRRTLEWIYEQEAAGLSWSQRAGHRQLNARLYDYGTTALAQMSLIGGRYERKRGSLAYSTFAEAAHDLAAQWRSGGGYVASGLTAQDLTANSAEQAEQSR